MKITTTYQCDICKQVYDSIDECKECEKEGLQLHKVEKYTIFKVDDKVFGVAVEPIHDGHIALWDCNWFRDNGNGDSIGRHQVQMQEDSSIKYNKTVGTINCAAWCRAYSWIFQQQNKVN
jgi:hypothetical protein